MDAEEQQNKLAPSARSRGKQDESCIVVCSALSVPQPVFTITEKARTRAFSWLKVPTSVFTFKTPW